MLKTVMKVNDLYYAGESDECYKSDFSGIGWYDYKDKQLAVLKFVDRFEDALIIEGNINLKSHLDRVLQRVRDKVISLKNIEIIEVNSYAKKEVMKNASE